MNSTEMKKTGETPKVEEGLGKGEVLGALQVNTYLVRYRDGHGVESTKLAIIVPGGEIYFFGKESLDTRPAQTWLKDGINRKVKNAGL